jgi:septal ring factor EnvC (AmiA/AmiB activator)
MNNRDLPKPVRDKLLALSAQSEQLVERERRTKEAISNARARLTGKFNNDSEYEDTYGVLKKLVADMPIIERKRGAAQSTYEECAAWIENLPDDVTLEAVKVRSNGADLATVKERLTNAKDELETLSKVPVPPANVDQRVKEYVGALARPTISGISDGELKVSWPDGQASLLAFLLPDAMTNALMREINRLANTPMPLPQRKQRIAELKAEIDTLQRQAFALGANDYATPPEIILGVKVRREAVKKAETRRNTRVALAHNGRRADRPPASHDPRGRPSTRR